MQFSRFRFFRGLIGTTLTWGIAWSSFHTVVSLARGLPTPPDGVSRAKLAYLTLRYQSPTTFFWGCVLGVAFSLFVAAAARRWPTGAPLRSSRLITLGAAAGLAVPSLFVGLGSLLNITAIALCSLTGAGIGAVIARTARLDASQSLQSFDHPELPSA